MKVRKFFSQSEFYMGSHCGLQCEFCDSFSFDFQIIKDSIVSGTFFERFPRTEWVNIIGCKLEEYDTLSFLITYLKSEDVQIRFWNHGVVDIDIIESVYDRCDEIMLYCPSVDERIYQDLTVNSTFEEFNDVISFLQGVSAPFNFYTPVVVEYIGDLPDIHEFVKEKGVGWILHYMNSWLNSDQKGIVRRYYNIQDVDVFKVRENSKQKCIALPFPAYKSFREQFKNKILNLLAKTR